MLGICAGEFALWFPLEYDDRYEKQQDSIDYIVAMIAREVVS